MHATSDASVPDQDLVVQVGEIRDLFAAPDTDPLAQHEGEVMGEPALRRVARPIRTSSAVHRFLRGLQIEIRPQVSRAATMAA